MSRLIAVFEEKVKDAKVAKDVTENSLAREIITSDLNFKLNNVKGELHVILLRVDDVEKEVTEAKVTVILEAIKTKKVVVKACNETESDVCI